VRFEKTPMRDKAELGVAAALIALAALVAAERAPAQGATPQPQLLAAPAMEVIDETGRRVSVPQPVRRIVSLAPSLTETIYALGAQDRLVGVTDYCDYPPEARTKPRVGGIINPNLEEVVALKPDLVLLTKSANRRETAAALDRLGLAAYATDPHSVEGVLASTSRLAEVIGARAAGAELLASLRARLDELKRLLGSRPPRRVLFVVWRDPLISVGRDTFLGDALRWAGAESVVETAQEWPRVSLEEVVRLQPDYLIFASAQPEAGQRDFEALRDQPGWRSLEAVRRRRVAVISDAVNHPSPRLVDAIFELARKLHPEAFAEKQENGRQKLGHGRKGSGQAEREQLPFFAFRRPLSCSQEEQIPCAR